jgi:hypothetical protein
MRTELRKRLLKAKGEHRRTCRQLRAKYKANYALDAMAPADVELYKRSVAGFGVEVRAVHALLLAERK